MMRERKNTLVEFEPYSKDYIGGLLGRLQNDVQDNTPISPMDYLKFALSACQRFNEILGDDTFDSEG